MGDHMAVSTLVARLLEPQHDLAACADTLRSRRVLVRADLNVPLRADGTVADATRIDAALATVRLLAGAGARVIVASHLGRPEPGKESAEEMRCRDSLRPVAAVLRATLGEHTFLGLADDCTGPSARALVGRLQDGTVCLLENTRFDARDVADDDSLAQELASLCDVYVLDGFGVSHRAQASVSGVARHLPPAARFPGLLVRSELQYLTAALDAPTRPFGVILGGMKVRDKLGILWALIDKADVLIVGGKMAFTFLASRGVAVGATQIEADFLDAARGIEAAAAAKGVRLLLPCDVLTSASPDEAVDVRVTPLTAKCCTADSPCLPPGSFGMDIGPETADSFAAAIAGCRTLLWNGPMGRFEVPAFGRGTDRIMHALADAHAAGAVVVAAGGDSVSALNAAGLAQRVTHVSTGGGASLQLLEGKAMPGLQALIA
jgi:phosphoglycerate kinase